jgi:hypothetical protein
MFFLNFKQTYIVSRVICTNICVLSLHDHMLFHTILMWYNITVRSAHILAELAYANWRGVLKLCHLSSYACANDIPWILRTYSTVYLRERFENINAKLTKDVSYSSMLNYIQCWGGQRVAKSRIILLSGARAAPITVFIIIIWIVQ